MKKPTNLAGIKKIVYDLLNMIKLFIDTTSNKKIIVRLQIDEKEYVVQKELTSYKAQIILPVIVSLLKEYTLSFQDINAIEVNPGPGSFTGVRVGVSVANALSYRSEERRVGKESSLW